MITMRGLKPVIILPTAIALTTLAGLLYAAADSGKPTTQPASTQPASRPASQPASQPAKPQVVIETSMGRIVVQLHPDLAPLTVANFLQYTDEKFFDDILFHRVIKGFMIQGGGFNTNASQKPPTHKPVRNESSQAGSNIRGTLAMARTPNPNSATCQFFINLVDNNRLDYPAFGGGYTVFGHVVEGMDVVDRIADVPVERSEISEAQPLKNVVITSIRRK